MNNHLIIRNGAHFLTKGPLSAQIFLFCCGCIILLLQGCSAATVSFSKLQLVYAASPQVNLDLNNNPSPVVVVVYQLKAINTFKSADFFTLYDKPEATLGSDLVDKSQVEMQPNHQLTTVQDLSPDTRYIGVLAAYRDITHTQWRIIMPLGTKKNKIIIRLDKYGVRAELK